MEDRPKDPLSDEDLEQPVPEDHVLPSRGARPMSTIAVASAKVAAIVEAAERAAEDLRLKTEEKARQRIAEADRAANLRVEAAEAEARDLLDAARRDAAAVEAKAKEGVRLIHERASQAREEAEARKVAAVQEAQDEAARVRAEADAYAEDTKRNAKADARNIIAEAHDAARGVLHDGSLLSGHLQELSVSLHRNAERLLNDVKLTHAHLTAGLDQAATASPADPPPRTSRSTTTGARPTPSGRGGDEDLDVPEFVPGRR